MLSVVATFYSPHYEGGVKVPLMMFWPAGIPPGSYYEEWVQNIDFTPTFFDLAGVSLDVPEHLMNWLE